MSQLIDLDSARRWLVEAFTEYHDARTKDGFGHLLARDITWTYRPAKYWPGHRLTRRRQAEVRRAAGQEIRQQYPGFADTGSGPRLLGILLRGLTGQQDAEYAAAKLYPEGE